MNTLPPSDEGAIRKAVKTRQREVARQTAELKQVSGIEDLEQRPVVVVSPASKAVPAPPTPSPGKRATQSVDYVKQVTQTLEIVQHTAGWTRHQLITALGALILVSLICLGGSLVSVGGVFRQPTPTLILLPITQASDAVKYLQKVGVFIENMQTLSVPNTTWTARQALRLTIREGTNSGTFLILSYPSAAQAGTDAFRFGFNKTWHIWSLVQFNNVLFLAAPDVSPKLIASLESHLTSYLIAPYRLALSTATPVLKP